MRRPRPAVIVLAVSVVVILVSVSIIVMTSSQRRHEAEISAVGSRDFVSASASPPVAASSAAPLASPAATEPASIAGSTASASGASASPTMETLPLPIRLRIKTLGVRARVVPVGLDKAGAVAIPKDVDKVGWYELGVPPGASRGSAVLAGHRDGTGQGRGVFYSVGQLNVGDKMMVRTADGVKHGYRVVARELISKHRLPLDELFSVDGPPRLTLISCGGYYDEANGGYQDNVVVTAVPVKAN